MIRVHSNIRQEFSIYEFFIIANNSFFFSNTAWYFSIYTPAAVWSQREMATLEDLFHKIRKFFICLWNIWELLIWQSGYWTACTDLLWQYSWFPNWAVVFTNSIWEKPGVAPSQTPIHVQKVHFNSVEVLNSNQVANQELTLKCSS